MLSTEMSPARPPLVLAPLLAGLGVLSTCSWGGGAAERTNDSAPVPVTVAPAVQKDAPVSLRAIGNVTAYTTGSLEARVEGRVARVHFAEGQEVKRGELLFSLDGRPVEAALRQADANLARDRAQAENARVEADRFARLVKDGIVSRDECGQAHARAASLEATVAADQAAVESARIQLQYCSIASPIDGRIGEILVHEGNVVKANETVLAVINQLRPIYVEFAVPQQALDEIRARMAGGELPVEAFRAADEDHPVVGALSFINNTVDTAIATLIMLAVLLFGGVAYRSLPVSDLPNVDLPTLLVSASLPGASPETMASSVATPLERQFSTIAGLSSMNSVNTLGGSQITLQFDLSRNIDAAAQDVQAAITLATPLLPPSMPTPPVYRKVNPADQPILFLALTSPTLPLWTLDEYGETLMAQRISMVSGVAQVLVYGAQKYAVRVQLDPDALASRGIGIDEVAKALQGANVNLPTGTLYGSHRAFTVQATGQLTSAEQYRPVIVAYRNGSPVRLEELGQVIDSVEDDKTASWYGSAERRQRSIVLAVQRQPGTNTVEVADAVTALLPTFKAWLPPSVQVEILFDRSQSIRASVRDVKLTMLAALVLVVLVIFAFLRNVSATIIPSLALPLSVVGTFAAMQPLGYSLDNLSLMALTLSIGFVVDDAIVILENIVRHMEMGKAPLEAAYDGAAEVGFTILPITRT